jgi:hypothetical protein
MDVTDDEHARVYNGKACEYLCMVLFHPSSPVAQHVRGQWTCYATGEGSARDKLVQLILAVFDAPVKLEIGETHIQVLDVPALRIPRATFSQFKGTAKLLRGLSLFFRTSRTSLAAQCMCYVDYKFNDVLHGVLDRGGVACELVRYLLASSPDVAYYSTRNEIHAACVILWSTYWNRCSEGGFTDQRVVEALSRMCDMTRPHSPIVRSASPETVRLRLSSSAETPGAAASFAALLAPRGSSDPRDATSASSVFYVSHDARSQFSLCSTPP